ncbi:MAG: chitin synthase-domain-containing protein, partial [Piptocephalis tieghemiana]
MLGCITLIKFISAVAFAWVLSRSLGRISSKPRDPSSRSHIFLLVTAYSEDEVGLRTTFDSMARTDYPEDHKVLFVIADGNVTGSGNDKSTPELCLDLMDRDNEDIPLTYPSVGQGEKTVNQAKVYTGHYVTPDGLHRIPYVLVWKCGLDSERQAGGGEKAGNRGKRDSQLILMRWLSRVCFNQRLSPLEYALFERVTRLGGGVTPDRYEMVLMVDADTLVMPDSVKYMVAAMERDPLVMGLCGETRISNKSQSWVTMIQVYEYYISHQLGKAFESIFGGVTCLPGCFCMYRIKSPRQDGYAVPVLANPDIVETYSSNDISTLHRKNLLLLGEDRYLTTLMLRAFPKRKMIYVPKAVCRTMVPDQFSVLLSQRRRWINSTVHNLLELIQVSELCGIFCCSMQFVIFLELTGTVVLPAALCFLLYLIIAACVGVNVTLPLVFMAAVFLLQAILVLFTSRKPMYLVWMLIFILAMPIWNFILPVYAFWHFDDFSWGATRQTSGGAGGGHEGGPAKEAGVIKEVEEKRWHEWKKE